MAEVIKALPPIGPDTGARLRHRWDPYLDGQAWKLGPSDFGPSKRQVAIVCICKAARRLGIRVVTRTVIDDPALYIQAFPAEKRT